MTTIATDGKVMASDSRVSGEYTDEAAKLFRVKGSIYGVSGSLTAAMVFIDWRKNPRKSKPDLNDGDLGVIEINKKGIWYWDHNLRPVQCVRKFAATGSGGDFAMGAMACGKSPREAVAVACDLDVYSDKPVVVMKL